MRRSYYLIGVQQGVEPFAIGPFKTGKERDSTARQVHDTQEDDDSLFWADIDRKGRLTVGPYIAGFFFPDSAEDHERG